MADPVDVKIGANIRSIRQSRNMSQEGLARKLGISFQQIQKYEKGANRAGGSRLYGIAQALGVQPGTLFEGIGEAEATAETLPRRSIHLAAKLEQIADPNVKDGILKLIDAAASLKARGAE